MGKGWGALGLFYLMGGDRLDGSVSLARRTKCQEFAGGALWTTASGVAAYSIRWIGSCRHEPEGRRAIFTAVTHKVQDAECKMSLFTRISRRAEEARPIESTPIWARLLDSHTLL